MQQRVEQIVNPDNESRIKELWTVKDVAQYLKLQPETIRNMARKGDLPAIKLSRMWRFSKDEVELWLESQAGNVDSTND